MSNPWEKYSQPVVSPKNGNPWDKYSTPTSVPEDEYPKPLDLSQVDPVTDRVNYNSAQSPTPQLAQPQQAPVAVPQTRELLDVLKGTGQNSQMGAWQKAQDVAQGLVEGPAAVISGAASFIPAVLSQVPTVLGGVMAGEPVAGMAEAGKGMEKFMEAFSTKPKSQFGQTIAEVAASPFTVAHEGIDAGVKALGGTDEQSQAAKFAFDSALAVLPHVASKLKRGEKLTAKEVEEVKAKVPAKVAPPDLLTDVLNKIKEVKPEAAPPPVAKFAENQSILDGLQVEVDKRSGPRRASYQKAVDLVKDHPEDVSTLDMNKISKKEGKVRALVQKLMEERDAKKVVEPIVEPTVENPPNAVDTEVPKFDQAIAQGISSDLTYLGPNKIGDFNLHEWRDEKTKGNFQTLTTDPAEVKAKMEKISEPLKEKVPELTREEVARKYSGIESPKVDEFGGLPVVDSPVVPLDFMREEQLRQIRSDLKQKLAERKAQREAEALAPETVVDPQVKTVRAQDLLRQFKELKKAQVENLNSRPRVVEDATFNKSTQESSTLLKESDLPLIDDNYSNEFDTLEELGEYMAASGLKGEVIENPDTGKWSIEPDLKELDDYAWDSSEFDAGEVEGFGQTHGSGEEVSNWSGDLSDTGTRNLWNIINNDRGSVDVTDLKIATDRLKEIQRRAEKLGKSVEEVLDMIGLDPETAKVVMGKMAQLPSMEDEIKKNDPVLYEIFRPKKGDPNVFGQQSKSYKRKGQYKAETSTFPAVTTDAFKTVWGAKKVLVSTNWAKKYMDFNTIRANTAEKLGVKELLYDKWIVKAADASRELKSQKKFMREFTSDLTAKERADISIIARSREEGGVAVLAADGITDIPQSNPKYEAKLRKMRELQDNLHDRHNYNRTRTGQRSIPYRENYFTWIRQENTLKKAGIDRNLNTVKLAQMQAHSSKFTGTNFPFAKPRSLKDIPVELDIFDNYITYVERGLRELHTAPVAALAKQLADLKVGKKNNALGLAEHNPGMYKFLVEWSDEINGVDRITQMVNAKFPGMMKAYNGLMNNMVAATLFGNAGTFMKQPLALRGVWADTTTFDTLSGILQTMKERTFKDKGLSSKSNILEIRTMEQAFGDMAKNLAKHGLRGLRDNAGMVTAWPMQIMDGLTAEAGWNAGYSFAKRKLGYDDAKAFQYAEDLVARTQGVGVKGATAPIQATGLFKMFTMFQTFAINDFNYLARDILRIDNPQVTNWKHVNKVLKYVGGGMLVNMLAQMAGLPTPFPSPIGNFVEKRDEGMSNFDATLDSFNEFLEVVPEIGGSLKYGSSLGGPLAELMSAVPDAYKGARYIPGAMLETMGTQVGSMDWYNMTDKQKMKVKLDTAKVVGNILGIPMTNQIVKSVRTSENGGDWYETILGIYIKAGEAGPPRPPSFDGGVGGLDIPKFSD